MFTYRDPIGDKTYREAILFVHERMRTASSDWEAKMAAAEDPDAASDACASLVRELDTIDVTTCPIKYQKQFLALVESLRTVRNVFSDHAHKADFNRRLNRAIRRTDKAGSKVNSVAQKYGVDIEPIKGR